MEIGLVGLGKMGGNMRTRMRNAGLTVIGYDRNPEVSDADSLAAMVEQLPADGPKVVWVMVPSGDPTRETIRELADLLGEGDLVVDGGNSRWTDDAINAAAAGREGRRLRRLRRLRRRLGPGERLRADVRRVRGRRRQGAAGLRRPAPEGESGCVHAGTDARCRPLRQDGPQRHRVRRDAGLRRGLGAARGHRPRRERHRRLRLLARGHRDPLLAARPAGRGAQGRHPPGARSAATPTTRARAAGPWRPRSSTPYPCT